MSSIKTTQIIGNTIYTTEVEDPADQPDDGKLVSQLADIAKNVKSNGGDSTGTNPSTTALQNSLNVSGDVLLPLGTFKLNGKVYFNNPVLLKGSKGSLLNQTSTATDFDFQVASSDVELERVSIQNTTGNNMFVLQANVSNFKMYKTKLNAQGTAIYMGVMNLNDIYIDGCDIKGQWYGILMDSGCQSGQNLLITNSKIYSETTDAIEINLPNNSNVESVFHSIRIIGNTISTGLTGNNASAGFAIGIANAKNTTVVGNTITQSRLEAIHIEDAQSRLVVESNTAEECNDSGMKVYRATASSTIDGKPALIRNNHFKKAVSKWHTNYGIYNESPLSNISDNTVEGFNQGIFIGSYGKFIMDKNVINDCSVGIEIVKNGEIIGTNYARNVPLLAQGGHNTVFGKIISETTPTKLLRYYDTSNYRGATLKGFKFPTVAQSFPANTTTNFNLFLLPDYMKGRLTVVVPGNSDSETTYNWGTIIADVEYNGGTLTLSNVSKTIYGSIDFASTPLVVNGTSLAIAVVPPSAQNFKPFDVNFDGEYTVKTYSAS